MGMTRGVDVSPRPFFPKTIALKRAVPDTPVNFPGSNLILNGYKSHPGSNPVMEAIVMTAYRPHTTQISNLLLALILCAQFAQTLPCHHQEAGHRDQVSDTCCESDAPHHQDGTEQLADAPEASDHHKDHLCALCAPVSAFHVQEQTKQAYPPLLVPPTIFSTNVWDHRGEAGYANRGPPQTI